MLSFAIAFDVVTHTDTFETNYVPHAPVVIPLFKHDSGGLGQTVKQTVSVEIGFATVAKLTLLIIEFALAIAFSTIAGAVPGEVADVQPLGPYAPLKQSSDCDPNYSGCVPVASDVDCAGGSGNGPAYVSGPIKVVGTDIYELDRDGNGTACE
ncbi:MAG: conserved hypothetical secreted protein [Mycobacterium sp.]|nr:conserved hypothetical secreted protein [Mycobacterium sp.]